MTKILEPLKSRAGQAVRREASIKVESLSRFSDKSSSNKAGQVVSRELDISGRGDDDARASRKRA
jgi:hypothetical protein